MGIQVYRDISVDFSNGRYILINAKQHDSKSRFIRMTCTNVGQKVNLHPDNYSAFIRYRKSDGYGVFNKCIIATTGEVIFELTEQMLSTVGTSYADLVIIDIAKSDINNDLTIISADGRIIENNSSLASTMTFYINVLEKPLNNWDVESTNEFSALNDLLLKASKDYEYIVQTAKEYMDNAKISENNAKISETNAKQSENNTKISETNAKDSELICLDSVDRVAMHETNTITAAINAKISETNAKNSEDNAKNYKEQAENFATNAKQSEDNAKISETNAKQSEDNAKISETNAKQSETNAKENEQKTADEMIATYNSALLAKSYTNGDTSGMLTDEEWNKIVTEHEDYIPLTIRENEDVDNAKNYKEQAENFATNAKQSEDNAKISEMLARSYVKGDTNIRPNEIIDNAKHYYEQSKQISEGLNGALLPMGTIQFSQLSIQTKSSGYMYNILDDFISDNTFKDGGGILYPAGTNVYYTADGFWDCLAGIIVAGVKGNAEENYRKGYINLTPENIGAYSKEEMQDILIDLTDRITALERKMN